MDLDAFIKSDPLIVLGGVFVAGGALVAGVMGYFAREGQARADGAAKAAADRAALAAAADVEALKAQLRDSADHYKMIERKVGGDSAVIDVTRLTASSFELLNLGAAYKSLENGRFRLRTPPGKGWTYAETTEAEVTRDTFVDVPDKLAGLLMVPPAAETMIAHIWRGGQPLKTQVTDQLPGPPATATWQFWPQVLAQFVSNAQLAVILQRPADATPDGDAGVGDRLLAIMRGQFALAYLMGQLQGLFQLSALFANFETLFETIRQVDDVLYARLKIEFGGPPETRLTLFREWLVVTVKDGVYLIRIDIPVRDGGSDAREWTNEWLSGLRLPSGA